MTHRGIENREGNQQDTAGCRGHHGIDKLLTTDDPCPVQEGTRFVLYCHQDMHQRH
jgi:hypothetical protein